MEELQARHRKEQQDLQAKITQKKKSATKRTRKGVNDDCERLQRELEDRQQIERAKLNGLDDPPTQDLDDLNLTENVDAQQPDWTDETSNRETIVPPGPGSIVLAGAKPKKSNRQKERRTRRAAEQEALAAKAEQETTGVLDKRKEEQELLRERIRTFGLKEIEVRPDGHCLYSAIAYQLDPTMTCTAGRGFNETAPSEESYQTVRNAAASFISQHSDDFIPFLDEPFEAYVQRLKDTAEWGGQLELQAISKAYSVQINVLQATGEIVKFEPENNVSHKPIWLAYYRYSFGLGEHYNALLTS